MNKTINLFNLFIIVIIFTGCNNNMDTKESLVAVDRNFSKFSEENGMNAAFMEYISDDGVMLRSNSMPIVGKNDVANLFSGNDSSLKLTWEPLYADVALSGELGYTYGTYRLEFDGNAQTGTYVSIWKKDKEGSWKFVLDSGNEGLGE